MTPERCAAEGDRAMTKSGFQNKPVTFHESLHLCGCESCQEEIVSRVESEPPLKKDFVAYLVAEYPKTAKLLGVKK